VTRFEESAGHAAAHGAQANDGDVWGGHGACLSLARLLFGSRKGRRGTFMVWPLSGSGLVMARHCIDATQLDKYQNHPFDRAEIARMVAATVATASTRAGPFSRSR
jgi:hypothetical protein